MTAQRGVQTASLDREELQAVSVGLLAVTGTVPWATIGPSVRDPRRGGLRGHADPSGVGELRTDQLGSVELSEMGRPGRMDAPGFQAAVTPPVAVERGGECFGMEGEAAPGKRAQGGVPSHQSSARKPPETCLRQRRPRRCARSPPASVTTSANLPVRTSHGRKVRSCVQESAPPNLLTNGIRKSASRSSRLACWWPARHPVSMSANSPTRRTVSVERRASSSGARRALAREVVMA